MTREEFNNLQKQQKIDLVFDSMVYLMPFAVIEMSKQIPMDLDEYVKKSRENGSWLRHKDKIIKNVVTTKKENKKPYNPNTLTKINIALICIAVFITIINILCAIC